ncbi:hypothetical protein BJQ97_00250 [Geobacillus sp. TFV-3]|nr:hypothetical protein BJQ97_00250 [Geobacillus sp. TFV-3]
MCSCIRVLLSNDDVLAHSKGDPQAVSICLLVWMMLLYTQWRFISFLPPEIDC